MFVGRVSITSDNRTKTCMGKRIQSIRNEATTKAFARCLGWLWQVEYFKSLQLSSIQRDWEINATSLGDKI